MNSFSYSVCGDKDNQLSFGHCCCLRAGMAEWVYREQWVGGSSDFKDPIFVFPCVRPQSLPLAKVPFGNLK